MGMVLYGQQLSLEILEFVYIPFTRAIDTQDLFENRSCMGNS